jgi:hypothetical protein
MWRMIVRAILTMAFLRVALPCEPDVGFGRPTIAEGIPVMQKARRVVLNKVDIVRAEVGRMRSSR